MDILRLLEQLNKLTVEDPHSFGPLTWGLNRDEISMQIAKIRASLPQELKNASTNVRESERIVDGAREEAQQIVGSSAKDADRIVVEAKAEAARLLEKARLQQDEMLAESEILKLSKAQCEEIRNAADRDAMNVRRSADKYALDILNHLENVLGKTIGSIGNSKQEFERGESPANPKERVRI